MKWVYTILITAIQLTITFLILLVTCEILIFVVPALSLATGLILRFTDRNNSRVKREISFAMFAGTSLTIVAVLIWIGSIVLTSH